ncbi:hypothetical protein LTR36_002790 [Oleoguttula mirabilis]|uniref:Endonuclease/exonuclease/phosphatase domain-containing protein n=1 Tax=Oleoguttula mirabilis TaxID=1507867 RepID=A0AAV9JJK5_9PEZI|nr:hypothetical protein LTR36_002790 [Oleoguttula mirabilis]
MDALVTRSIQLVQAKKKGDVPWTVDEPHSQPCHIWANEQWQSLTPSSNDNKPTANPSRPAVKSLALYSWNIDYMLPFPDSRMRAALRHLETQHIAPQDPSAATVIFLNECVQSDLTLIAEDAWVRKTFQITDVDGRNWQSGHYGTMTLIDRRLAIDSCFRVHYSKTQMERDGLFVDIRLGDDDGGKIVRLCNTHLESLAIDPPFRPPQLAVCASYLHDKAVHGAILAGDLNAIQDFDKHLHTDNDLKDAYLKLGGREDDAEGHTWGQQAATVQRERFGTSRMDKVLYCGGVQCKVFERFGGGVEVEDRVEREELVELGFDRPWVTDHLGVKGVFEVTA